MSADADDLFNEVAEALTVADDTPGASRTDVARNFPPALKSLADVLENVRLRRAAAQSRAARFEARENTVRGDAERLTTRAADARAETAQCLRKAMQGEATGKVDASDLRVRAACYGIDGAASLDTDDAVLQDLSQL